MNESQLYPPAPNHSANEVQPGIAIGPEINPVPIPPGNNKLKFAIVGAIVIIAIGGLIGLGYAKGYSIKGLSVLTPTKVWEKFYSSSSAKVYNATFKADYSDPEVAKESENDFGMALKDIKLHLEGTTYANVTDISKPEIDGSVKFTVGSGNTSFSSGIDYRALNNNLFYKVGDIPFLSALMTNGDKKVDWVKINLDKAKTMSSEESNFFQSIGDPTFQDKIRKIWLDNRAIKLNKYVGRETINGVATLHFRAELDKDATKKAVMETITSLAELDKSSTFNDDDKSLLDATIDKLLGKIEVKELDAWVGTQDQNLYKLRLVSNAPSFVSLMKLLRTEAQTFGQDDLSAITDKKKVMEDFLNKLSFDATFTFETTYNDYGKTKKLEEPANAYDIFSGLGGLDDARFKSRDAKRVADVRQMASALELYFNDNNWYPYGLSDLAPTYLGTLPSVPTPPDNNCTEQQNAYSYTYIDATHYKLGFCLGDTTGGLGAGVHTLTPAGIE